MGSSHVDVKIDEHKWYIKIVVWYRLYHAHGQFNFSVKNTVSVFFADIFRILNKYIWKVAANKLAIRKWLLPWVCVIQAAALVSNKLSDILYIRVHSKDALIETRVCGAWGQVISHLQLDTFILRQLYFVYLFYLQDDKSDED